MPQKIIRIATRNSPLALWQANHVREQLMQLWPTLSIELLPIETSGDKFLKDKLVAVGGKGLFVKELEQALLDEQADLAVHSMKDVPATFPQGLSLATICKRHTPFDALVNFSGLNFNQLPHGARIGTSSLRRQSQLLARRADLCIIPLRGNIHTRINKLHAGEFDAIILAAAGLERMELHHLIQEILPDNVMLPACGQGALGIECRSNDTPIQHYIAPLHDEATALCVNTERHVSKLLGGNCHTSLAVYCQLNGPTELILKAKVASADGLLVISNIQQGLPQDAMHFASRCADELFSQGAAALQ